MPHLLNTIKLPKLSRKWQQCLVKSEIFQENTLFYQNSTKLTFYQRSQKLLTFYQNSTKLTFYHRSQECYTNIGHRVVPYSRSARVLCVKAGRPIVWQRLWSLSVFPCQLFQLVNVNYCQLSVDDESDKTSR